MISKRILFAAFGLIFLVLAVFGIEVLMALPGPDEHFHNPTPEPHHFGHGSNPLTYLVIGDSTAAGEGASDPQHGIAYMTAQYLAQSQSVTMINLAVSGATLLDVQRDQLNHAMSLKPDIVLLAVGANDVTHFTSSAKIASRLELILSSLSSVTSHPKIVVTGSPAMGTARRFAQPLRWFAGVETSRVNNIMKPICIRDNAIWAPIAKATSPLFARNPYLLSIDRFHPNDAGYATWMPTLNTALEKTLSQRYFFHSTGLAIDWLVRV